MTRLVKAFLSAFVVVGTLCLIAAHLNDGTALTAVQGAIAFLALKGIADA